jgi:hypothetical protein
MQHLEDALNICLCGHFLIMLAMMCFTAFSVVTVRYRNGCVLLHCKIVSERRNVTMCGVIDVHKYSITIFLVDNLSIFICVCVCVCVSIYS